MSFRVVFRKAAERDMNEIEAYLSQFYAGTVLKFFDKLEKRVNALKEMPFMCPAYENDPFFRRMVLNDYLLFYSVDEKRKFVVIHRVFHSKRNVDQQMLLYRGILS
jgi:plasmid stabilization system protein ParE